MVETLARRLGLQDRLSPYLAVEQEGVVDDGFEIRLFPVLGIYELVGV